MTDSQISGSKSQIYCSNLQIYDENSQIKQGSRENDSSGSLIFEPKAEG